VACRMLGLRLVPLVAGTGQRGQRLPAAWAAWAAAGWLTGWLARRQPSARGSGPHLQLRHLEVRLGGVRPAAEVAFPGLFAELYLAVAVGVGAALEAARRGAAHVRHAGQVGRQGVYQSRGRDAAVVGERGLADDLQGQRGRLAEWAPCYDNRWFVCAPAACSDVALTAVDTSDTSCSATASLEDISPPC
jgi:hypothetical protein